MTDERSLTLETAERFARIALGHVTREYPHKLDHILTYPEEPRRPSQLHPIFYGSFDWHSCVHGYWLLARLLNRYPAAPFVGEVAALFDKQLTLQKGAVERDYFAAPSARGFERPYGWAWLLKLAAELRRSPQPRWFAALEPLAEVIATRLGAFLPVASYPVRTGTHYNHAFAIRMAADYAQSMGDDRLLSLLRTTAERWFGSDCDCPAWGEPGGDEFLSPALIEAECMRRLLPPGQFPNWFARFLPQIADSHPKTLFVPAEPTDRSDGKIAHLDGLNLSRAWCFRSLARAFADSDDRSLVMLSAADAHLTTALPHIEEDYMGEHWLASFALLALEA